MIKSKFLIFVFTFVLTDCQSKPNPLRYCWFLFSDMMLSFWIAKYLTPKAGIFVNVSKSRSY